MISIYKGTKKGDNKDIFVDGIGNLTINNTSFLNVMFIFNNI